MAVAVDTLQQRSNYVSKPNCFIQLRYERAVSLVSTARMLCKNDAVMAGLTAIAVEGLVKYVG